VTFGHHGCCTTSGCVHPREHRKGVKWPSVTSGSYVTTAKKKAREKPGHAQNLLPVMATSGQGPFRLRDFVTFGQKAPLGRIWPNFRFRMRRTYLRTGSLPVTWMTSLPVTRLTSLPVTSLPVAPPHHSTSNANLSVPIYHSPDHFKFLMDIRTIRLDLHSIFGFCMCVQ
jgi:hypothetical protein